MIRTNSITATTLPLVTSLADAKNRLGDLYQDSNSFQPRDR